MFFEDVTSATTHSSAPEWFACWTCAIACCRGGTKPLSRRMGREAHQGEIGLVIGDEYLAFRDFSEE